MASQFDDSDFIDRDFQSSQGSLSTGAAGNGGPVAFRPPSPRELDTRVGDAQQKLAALKRAQEELERERAALEDARRRRIELQTGREEMLQNLVRGVALLEQSEFAARRDAEQMAKSLTGLREALKGVQAVQEEAWTQQNWNEELARALATIENARMEWNSARLKWAMLNGEVPQAASGEAAHGAPTSWGGLPFRDLCRVGLALTWPVAVVGLIGVLVLLLVRSR